MTKTPLNCNSLSLNTFISLSVSLSVDQVPPNVLDQTLICAVSLDTSQLVGRENGKHETHVNVNVFNPLVRASSAAWPYLLLPISAKCLQTDRPTDRQTERTCNFSRYSILRGCHDYPYHPEMSPTVAGPIGAPEMRAPSQYNFFNFHAVFWTNWSNNRLVFTHFHLILFTVDVYILTGQG